MTFKHQDYVTRYQNWLQNHERQSSNDLEETASQTASDHTERSNNIASTSANSQRLRYPQGHGPDEVNVFENDQIAVFVVRAFHQRQKRFRLQDYMFHVRVKVKENIKTPLLRDLVTVLKEAFVFILNNIRTYFKPEDHNIAYLTLYQEPMVNGLNTGNKI